ncbi:MAG TPA: hypothetical protein VD886_21205, partial [Herpetosiphonaceae bacterium]|nr:hypothetical protein [Herpetosiphonaceae bacterium]
MHRMYRRAAMCLLLFMALGFIPSSAYAEENADVQAIASGLQSIGSRIGLLTGFDDIGAALPLSSLSLDGADALDLANLLPASLGSALGALPSPATYADLQNAIAGASGTYGGIAVTFDDVLVSQNGGLVDVQFSLSATRTVSAPFSLSEGVVELS